MTPHDPATLKAVVDALLWAAILAPGLILILRWLWVRRP